jgi:photoactive yellow protein
MDTLISNPPISPAERDDSGETSPTSFADPGVFDWLCTASAADLDRLPYGVIAMSLDGTVEAYNSTESRLAGLKAERVLGKNFFTSVAPCTNNFMVAHRFQTEADLDAVIDYVLTLRMRPQKVHLRMLRSPVAARMFLLIQRRG